MVQFPQRLQTHTGGMPAYNILEVFKRVRRVVSDWEIWPRRRQSRQIPKLYELERYSPESAGGCQNGRIWLRRPQGRQITKLIRI